MQVASSAYLASAKPFLRGLVAELTKLYPYASVLGEDCRARSFRVAATGMSAGEDGMLTSCGFVARVWKNGWAEFSFNELPADRDAAAFARKIARAVQPPMTDDPPPADEPLTLCRSSEYKIDPESLGSGEWLSRLSAIREEALAMDERLVDVPAMCSYQVIHKLFLSPSRDLEQNLLWTTGGLLAMALRGEELKNAYRPFSGLAGAEVLENMREGIAEAVRGAIDLLDSEPIPPGEYDCVCTPAVTGMIAHEAFGHGVEMDMFVKKRALAEKYVGERVASDLVTMRDGAAAAEEVASAFFDDEGSAASDTVVIERGILRRGICDLVSAGRLGAVPTGNGRRESYERKAYTRMTNTFFEGGTDKPEDMIASIQYGFLLDDPTSGMEDPKNWGIQCMVGMAREIRDGALTGRVFSPIVLTGYVPDLLRSISMMSERVELGGGGYCGKGYKEWVKVSDGGPYIKARIRLG